MHKFARALGLSEIKSRAESDAFIRSCVENAEIRTYITNEDGEMLAEYRKEIIHDRCGIAVVGFFDDDEHFTIEYSYPYLLGTSESTNAPLYVQKKADRESYLGSCEEVRVGVTLVFHLLNMIPYLKHEHEDEDPLFRRSVTLSALSTKGKILMPIAKSESQILDSNRRAKERYRKLYSARNGDEAAIESLTLNDMDLYTTISERIRKDDLYTMVDTSFMPFGMECDQYTVIGEIFKAQQFQNSMTGERFWILSIVCNNLLFDVCINDKDLYGEPQAGRRFKGNLWMQGNINFDD